MRRRLGPHRSRSRRDCKRESQAPSDQDGDDVLPALVQNPSSEMREIYESGAQIQRNLKSVGIHLAGHVKSGMFSADRRRGAPGFWTSDWSAVRAWSALASHWASPLRRFAH